MSIWFDEARSAADDHARLVEKWDRDTQALYKVIKSHRDILMYCETIRRKIHALELKRQEYDHMRSQCGEFVGTNAGGDLERPDMKDEDASVEQEGSGNVIDESRAID